MEATPTARRLTMRHFAGLDWGSVEHAACVIDEQGTVVAQLDVPHTAEGLQKLLTRLARIAPPLGCPSPSSAPAASWWTRSSRPAIRSCRSIPTRSRPVGPAIGPPAARATRVTRTTSPTSCAPTGTASARCALRPTRCAPCARSSAPATTWWPSGWPSRTSSDRCSTASGRAPAPSSRTWTRPSRSPSWRSTRPPRARGVSA